MTYPHADPRRYEGLLAHTERHLGPVIRGWGPMVDGRNGGFSIGLHARPESQMVSLATTGVRLQKIAGPEEFVISVLPAPEEGEACLLHVIADRAVQSGKGFRARRRVRQRWAVDPRHRNRAPPGLLESLRG